MLRQLVFASLLISSALSAGYEEGAAAAPPAQNAQPPAAAPYAGGAEAQPAAPAAAEPAAAAPASISVEGNHEAVFDGRGGVYHAEQSTLEDLKNDFPAAWHSSPGGRQPAGAGAEAAAPQADGGAAAPEKHAGSAGAYRQRLIRA
ncbi:hypothetical protein AAVH_03711 [Aphelenchoides avenae]|nr:hypothetical protein AAVH_03711 [Aphelenchus avenae]